MRQALGWSAALLALASGCVSTSARMTAVSYEQAPPPEKVCGVVYCADGAGGYRGTTEALREGLAQQCKPLHVERVDWSHGYRRVAADHFDQQNIEEQGRCLAARVQAWLAKRPGQPVYLVGHSAGCAVLLNAAERLPPNSLERIIFLAPSVSACYDLRPALTRARRGIDSFNSHRDWIALGIATRLFGTTDRRRGVAAGRYGFNVVGDSPCDHSLYARLRQHPWDPCQAWTGNEGGHYGTYRPGFLCAYVLPLINCR